MAYAPLSRAMLLRRGKCCGNGCTNCPWSNPMDVWVVTQDTRFPYRGASYVEVVAATADEAASLLPPEWPSSAPMAIRRSHSASMDDIAKGPHVKRWW